MTTKAKKPRQSKAISRKDSEEDSARGKHFVNGLAKGLSMIQAFSAEAPALTLAEAAVATGLTRASARRLLMTLEDLGFVAREGVRHFILTPKVLALGYSYLASTPLWSFASPILQDLVEDVRETCAIAVQDDTDLVYVLRIPIHRILSQGVLVGSRLPLYCHSAGRVLLSDLSPAQLDSYFMRARLKAFTPRTVVDPARLRKLLKDVIRQHYAWVSSEIEENIAGLSVPIRQVDGRVIAALNVSINQPAVKEEAMVKRLLPSLQAAADRIQASLLVGQPMRRAAGAQYLKGRGG
jgi:IclR family pca regulon transcriptional regulator